MRPEIHNFITAFLLYLFYKQAILYELIRINVDIRNSKCGFYNYSVYNYIFTHANVNYED